MQFLPTINNYMSDRYSNDNYGAHSLCVDMGNIILYYSYKTIVAFSFQGRTMVRKNDWGPTTGKHLNKIDGGSKEARENRVKGEEFEEKLAQSLKTLGY